MSKKIINGKVYLYMLHLEELPDLSDVEVDGDFNCSHNQLTSLEGSPWKVNNIYCMRNKLTSLEGSPTEIIEGLYCGCNKLTTLEGSPRKMVGNLKCNNNQLTSLKGAPIEVGGYFDCSFNQLTSLEGLPKFIGRSLYIMNNQRKFTEEEILNICEVKGEIYV